MVPLCLLCAHVHTLCVCVGVPFLWDISSFFLLCGKKVLKQKYIIEKRVCLSSIREVLSVLTYFLKMDIFCQLFPSFFFFPSLFPPSPLPCSYLISTFLPSHLPLIPCFIQFISFYGTHSQPSGRVHLTFYTVGKSVQYRLPNHWPRTAFTNECITPPCSSMNQLSSFFFWRRGKGMVT